MNSDRKIIIIAGPNGAGKTTFAQEYLPREAGYPVFVNADIIATGLSPLQPEAVAFRAARMMLNELDFLTHRGDNIAFETTLAGRVYVKRIKQWRKSGYNVKMIFLALATPEEAIARVVKRVRLGGHDIPQGVIRRRFHAGLRNFDDIYSHCVDYWVKFNNSGHTPTLEDEGVNVDEKE